MVWLNETVSMRRPGGGNIGGSGGAKGGNAGGEDVTTGFAAITIAAVNSPRDPADKPPNSHNALLLLS